MSRSLLNHNFAARIAVAALVCCIGAAIARADEPSVTAVLDSSETVVGQPVQLQIKVSGARNATLPDNFNVPGLDIRYTGQSQQIEGRNFQFSYSVVYSYTIMAERAGSFKIPPQTITVGGKTLRTPELSLNVANTSGGSARSNGPQGAIDPSKIAFVELVVAKTNAYVGEMIPAEVRLGFSTRTPAESLGNGIDLTGQGFTTQKMRDPRQTVETIRGKSYQMFIFKTAISPVRAGKIDVGPIEANPVVRVPQGNRARPSMRDPFGLNDPFFDNFFNDPAFAPSMPRQIKLRSEAAVLDVKPLPPNAPPSFSGAVGTFTMTTDAKPLSGKAGDPITVTSNISGRGNFDRVAAPTLEDEKGWHKYPPSSQFKQDDDVGISGTKTFETVISANERKDKLPPFAFTFFDPLKEQYVTLRSDPIPVHIEGGAPPTPTPAAATAAAAASPRTQPTPVSNASPTPAEDILYQLTQLPARQESFTPMFRRREFWLAQLLPLIALLALIGMKWRRVRANDRDARRAAELQHEAAELQRRLRRNDLPPREYFADAARAVQLKTAVRRNLAPQNVDAEVAANTFRVDDETRTRLRELFARSDELRYSGGGNGAAAVSAEHRREIQELIERL